MTALFRTADDVLRRRPWPEQARSSSHALLPLLACIFAFGGSYGAAMGLYRGLNGGENWGLQVAYSAVKTPLLLIVSFVVSLPSCFVLSTLFGLRDDFGHVIRALVAAQAALAIVLASLAPVTLLFYASSTDYRQALLFNGVMFALASLAGQALLRWRLRPLVLRTPRHRYLLLAWGIVYVFVAMQLAWLLRPFIGSQGMEVTFFREDAWDNAYVYVVRLLWRTLFG